MRHPWHLLSFWPTLLVAQAATPAPQAAELLRDYLLTNGKAAFSVDEDAFKFDQRITDADGCRLTLREDQDNSLAPVIRVFQVDLSVLAPKVEVKQSGR